MCAAKSPISILQELVVREHMPHPQYEIIQQGSGFKCIGSVGTLSITAVAESKKRAKHLCSEHVLELLGPQETHNDNCNNLTQILNHVGQAPILLNPVIQVEQVYVKPEEPNFNAVGKLNELCSQNGILYPNYEEAGVAQQKFVIKCALLSHVTLGQASTKKQAKQMAAKEMLSRVSLTGFDNVIRQHNLEQAKPKPAHNAEVEEKIIQLFKQLSTKTQSENEDVQINPFSQISRDLFPILQAEEPKERIEWKMKKVDEVTEEKLREELEQLNVTFRISEFQRHPLMLVLKTVPTRDHPSYTFMHTADTYELAVIGLLIKAVRDIKLMKK